MIEVLRIVPRYRFFVNGNIQGKRFSPCATLRCESLSLSRAAAGQSNYLERHPCSFVKRAKGARSSRAYGSKHIFLDETGWAQAFQSDSRSSPRGKSIQRRARCRWVQWISVRSYATKFYVRSPNFADFIIASGINTHHVGPCGRTTAKSNRAINVLYVMLSPSRHGPIWMNNILRS